MDELRRTGPEGSPHARWEKGTWPVLERLAREVPEAGVHIQSESHSHPSIHPITQSVNYVKGS